MKRILLSITLALSPMLAGPVVFSSSGATTGDITGALNQFRASLGGLNPNVATNFVGGRREINWDGVPAAATEPNAFPGSFFNGSATGRARGITFSTPGTSLLVSVPDAGDDYTFFSPSKVFEPVGSAITDVSFFSPKDQKTVAVTNAFGAIFLDVDDASTASMEFFNLSGTSLGVYQVPSFSGNKTFSFLGVKFDSPAIARVRIISSNPDDETAMDDFIFGEQTATPEPATYATLATALAGLAWIKRRRAAK
ncbi:MAG: PEP-CTERM sorting domain-containing protein [Acidobacteria bacterium]|nr:PEP-CTERM sorting domain-containing protein [Acidobacteriota bacterium]